MKLRQSGFTLTEVVVAIGILSFIVTLTVAQNLNIFQGQMSAFNHSNLAQDALSETRYLALQLEGMGGGAIRPWMAIWVENSCASRNTLPACNNSDRVTISSALSTPVDCAIKTHVGNLITVDNSTGCCLSNPAFVPSASNTGVQLMLSLGETSWAQVYSTVIDPVACTVTYVPGQASFANGNIYDQPLVNYATGTVSPITVATYFWDSTVNQIKMWSDLNNNGAIDAAEVSILAVQVFDLQVALGFDVTGNNVITDNQNATDNWLYNAPGDPALGQPGVFLTTTMPQLRMVEIGVIAGTQANYEKSQSTALVQLFDGPNRQAAVVGSDLRAISIKTTPRNNFIFR